LSLARHTLWWGGLGSQAKLSKAAPKIFRRQLRRAYSIQVMKKLNQEEAKQVAGAGSAGRSMYGTGYVAVGGSSGSTPTKAAVKTSAPIYPYATQNRAPAYGYRW
jgi:hypothetical protein